MPPADAPEPTISGDLTSVDAIRKRPGMYVGSTGFFGFINYLVCPIALLLARDARRIDVGLTDAGFELDSDARLAIGRAGDGRITPFESLDSPGEGHNYEGCVLNALSESLVASLADSGSSNTLTYRRGERISHTMGEDAGSFARLAFAPDASVFSVTSLSPAIFESYLRRLSFLHPRVRFRLTAADRTREFSAPGGIRDLFESVSAPYQLLHPPVHIAAKDGQLGVELVFAYHSWVDNWVWCFINNGRAVEGGTHEEGLFHALDKLYARLGLPKKPKRSRNGVVAVMSIIYPGAVWEGCIKARVGSPELAEIVSDLVVTNVMEWIGSHPEVTQQLRQLETFQFPEAWFS